MYSAEQWQELEKFFKSHLYPTSRNARLPGPRLKLQEHQVQVWFKSCQAKHSRLLGPPRQQGPSAGCTPGPGVCPTAPAPSSTVTVFPEGPVFSEDPVFSQEPRVP